MINTSPVGREKLGAGRDVEKNMESLWLPPLGSNLLLLPVDDFNILQSIISRLQWFLRYYLKSEFSDNGCLMFITSESISGHIPLAFGTPDINWTLTWCSMRHCTFSLDCHVLFSSISLKVSITAHEEQKQKQENDFQRWAGIELKKLRASTDTWALRYAIP